MSTHTMIILIDTFNNIELSRHRTLKAAERRSRKHLASVQRANGKNSYLTYGFKTTDGSAINHEDITAVRMELDDER